MILEARVTVPGVLAAVCEEGCRWRTPLFLFVEEVPLQHRRSAWIRPMDHRRLGMLRCRMPLALPDLPAKSAPVQPDADVNLRAAPGCRVPPDDHLFLTLI